jgi:two-component sensor histidine kinase
VDQLDASADKKTSSVTFSRYGVVNGLRTSEASSGGHPSAWRMQDGTLWFATLSGAAVVNPASLARNGVPPQTVIEQILVDDRPVDFDPLASSPAGKIPPGHHQIAIRYAGLSFTAPQQIQYRYRMEGFDTGLVDAHGRRTAYYNNLAPGRYRFSVLSANNDGVWSTNAAHVDLQLEPYFVQTVWFYALLTMIGLAVGYGLYRWRVVYVESKYKAVLAERGRIAREIHDTLAQGYVAVSVQLELATRLMKNSSQAAIEPLERSKELVREGLAEARSSIWNLRSQAEAETLPALLAATVERMNHDDVSGPVLKLEVKGTYRPLPREVEAELLRIVQEAVANASRHAAAPHIWIQLSYDGELLRLTVRDDGQGFNETENFAARGHYGLQGMRERASAIGARLRILSGQQANDARGTSVIVEMDMKQPYGKNIR